MTQDDYEDFAGMVGGITELYGRATSEFAIAIWWGALRQYDLAAVRQAFDRHVRNPDSGQFAPKPADLIRMMGGTTQDSALVAWAKVDRALRVVGTYRSVAFDDALVHRVLTEMGGWTALGVKTEKEWPFIAKEFENRYRGYRMRNEHPEYPPILVGLAEAQNAQAGFEGEGPTLIGDQEQAHRVIAFGSTQPLLEMRHASAMAMGVTRMNPNIRVEHTVNSRR
ncbi:DUF6475 domain-containing protein [Janthinobacterium sp. SUN118]|uniref:DUF6475 domain-containing protein n=1 Tax=Janthinobacterium sp. SUN118 TaxID=3004100 RepID=UPI0025B0B157|nr:DUF6475 domain-containing protein [Janthinobacterium sp. SUN118]MDN2710626.1 DUF6475 domain-containing protein [Janthinobacterium sp. SUN118]